jgi:hypothetical protein
MKAIKSVILGVAAIAPVRYFDFRRAVCGREMVRGFIARVSGLWIHTRVFLAFPGNLVDTMVTDVVGYFPFAHYIDFALGSRKGC